MTSVTTAVTVLWVVWYVTWIGAVVFSGKTRVQMRSDRSGWHRMIGSLGFVFLFVPVATPGAPFSPAPLRHTLCHRIVRIVSRIAVCSTCRSGDLEQRGIEPHVLMSRGDHESPAGRQAEVWLRGGQPLIDVADMERCEKVIGVGIFTCPQIPAGRV